MAAVMVAPIGASDNGRWKLRDRGNSTFSTCVIFLMVSILNGANLKGCNKCLSI
jgi:hypothetical protein